MSATDVQIPGLEAPHATVEPETAQRWIERGPQKRLMLFSGSSHPALAADIAENLKIELGQVELKTFAMGETYVRYLESIRGADLFIVQTGSPPVDKHLMELLIMVNAAKLASAKRITVVLPWFPYSRQEKKSAPREPITARLVADMLEGAGADRVLTMDLHAGQIQGFFRIPVDHMTALPLFAQYFRDKGLSGEKVVSVSPDPGRAKMARKFAQMLSGPEGETDLAIMNKSRPAHDQASITQVIGEVEGKVALMGDDMIATGSTLIAAVEALKSAGATAVNVFATHGHFAGNAYEKLADADIDEIVVTDTVPIDLLRKPEKVKVMPISKLLADSIWNVFSDESVSAIFAGENQLF